MQLDDSFHHKRFSYLVLNLSCSSLKMRNLNPNEVSIEIEKTVSQIELSKRSKWFIYRVPNDLCKLNKDAYTPQAVSIGPFHYGNERLQKMQTYKLEYFKIFVEKSGANLDDLVSFTEELESSVRHCYDENIAFDKKQLVKIILVDACFIIELFLRHYLSDKSSDDPVYSSLHTWHHVRFDLLLLENQLPYFVLEKLFNRALPSSESDQLPSFLKLTFNFFSDFNKQGLEPNDVKVCHFTDLVRYFHLQQPSTRPLKRIAEKELLNFNATKLHEAGVKFEVSNNTSQSQCLLGLKFSGHVLEIPKILVEDWTTELLFRNMVAFEQCHCPFEAYITDYVAIFDFLIDTGKDVDVLIQNGIILNYMDDSSAAAEMFNGLFKHVGWIDCNSDYVELCRSLKEFCNNPRQKLKATLRRDYCSTPWHTVVSIAGIVLLFLALVQTVCSVIPVIQNA